VHQIGKLLQLLVLKNRAKKTTVNIIKSAIDSACPLIL